MKAIFKRPQSALAIILSLSGIIPFWGEVALAQSVDTSTAKDPSTQSNEVNSNNPLGNGLDLNNLIHNANLRRSRSGGEFASDTQMQLKKAADDFKQMQLQRIQQQQTAPVAPTSAAPTGK